MATVLMTWELGGGLGHLMQLRAIGQRLLRRGHRVIAALREVSHAKQLVDDGVEVLKAPAKTLGLGYEILPPQTYAHLLHNIGFCEGKEASAMVSAWLAIYQQCSPDLILFDHSPTALLAARGL